MPVELVTASTIDWLNTPPGKFRLTQLAFESPAVIVPPGLAALLLLADFGVCVIGFGEFSAVFDEADPVFADLLAIAGWLTTVRPDRSFARATESGMAEIADGSKVTGALDAVDLAWDGT